MKNITLFLIILGVIFLLALSVYLVRRYNKEQFDVDKKNYRRKFKEIENDKQLQKLNIPLRTLFLKEPKILNYNLKNAKNWQLNELFLIPGVKIVDINVLFEPRLISGEAIHSKSNNMTTGDVLKNTLIVAAANSILNPSKTREYNLLYNFDLNNYLTPLNKLNSLKKEAMKFYKTNKNKNLKEKNWKIKSYSSIIFVEVKVKPLFDDYSKLLSTKIKDNNDGTFSYFIGIRNKLDYNSKNPLDELKKELAIMDTPKSKNSKLHLGLLSKKRYPNFYFYIRQEDVDYDLIFDNNNNNYDSRKSPLFGKFLKNKNKVEVSNIRKNFSDSFLFYFKTNENKIKETDFYKNYKNYLKGAKFPKHLELNYELLKQNLKE